MAKYGLNKVELIGNLGQDPEVRHTDKGIMYTTLNLACTERFRDREGNNVDRTEWLRVTLWRGQAEIASKYLRKGSTVFIEGRLRTSSWETPQGEKRSRTDIEGIRLILLDGRPQQSNPGGQGQMHSPVSQTNYQSQQSNPVNQQGSSTNNTPDIQENDVDDLPF
ncbi:MAG: single-stranded DNA-binding protein [Bacteroidia bacterium]|nr:single-stranded DNA-binding protein [Bacteroidia bacterium]